MSDSSRIGRVRYYLGIAEAVSQRSTCLRRRFGAVIVLNEQVIATGYCGAPRGVKDCLKRDSCLRQALQIPSGERYEMCRSIHAEQNAIINAARTGVNILGGVMYIWGFCREAEAVFNSYPCLMCLKMIINAGLSKVFFIAPDEQAGVDMINLADLREKWDNEEVFRIEEKE